MCYASNHKWQTASDKTLGEKENYKYLSTMEADSIKQGEMKEKI